MLSPLRLYGYGWFVHVLVVWWLLLLLLLLLLLMLLLLMLQPMDMLFVLFVSVD